MGNETARAAGLDARISSRTSLASSANVSPGVIRLCCWCYFQVLLLGNSLIGLHADCFRPVFRYTKSRRDIHCRSGRHGVKWILSKQPKRWYTRKSLHRRRFRAVVFQESRVDLEIHGVPYSPLPSKPAGRFCVVQSAFMDILRHTRGQRYSWRRYRTVNIAQETHMSRWYRSQP